MVPRSDRIVCQCSTADLCTHSKSRQRSRSMLCWFFRIIAPTMTQHWTSSLNEINLAIRSNKRCAYYNETKYLDQNSTVGTCELFGLLDEIYRQLTSHPYLWRTIASRPDWPLSFSFQSMFFSRFTPVVEIDQLNKREKSWTTRSSESTWINLKTTEWLYSISIEDETRFDEYVSNDVDRFKSIERKDEEFRLNWLSLSSFPSSSFLISPVIPFTSSTSRLIGFSFLSLALGHRSSIKDDAFHSLVAVPSHPIPSPPFPPYPTNVLL